MLMDSDIPASRCAQSQGFQDNPPIGGQPMLTKNMQSKLINAKVESSLLKLFVKKLDIKILAPSAYEQDD